MFEGGAILSSRNSGRVSGEPRLKLNRICREFFDSKTGSFFHKDT